MHNYRIHCQGNERAEILTVLRKYNDVIIDNVDDHSVRITIQRDDAEEFFASLLGEIEQQVFSRRKERAMT